jgi:hypothetical protein
VNQLGPDQSIHSIYGIKHTLVNGNLTRDFRSHPHRPMIYRYGLKVL